jgi:hypothetical protein
MPFVSDRHFRIWDYNVSHDQMLLRSAPTPDVSRNVDIIFWGVDYLGIPSRFTGVEIEEASPEEEATMNPIVGQKCVKPKIYRLSTEGKRYLVAAVGFRVFENDLELFESSLEYFSRSGPKKDLGQVLAHS